MKKVVIIILLCLGLCLGISLYYAYTHVWDILEFIDKLQIKEIIPNRWINFDSRLSVSPDGRLLLFDNSKGVKIYRDEGSAPLPASETNIYLLDLKTLHKRQLTNSPNRNYYAPAFSPDGTKIAFGSYMETSRVRNCYKNEIYIMDSDGQNVRKLVDTGCHDPKPSFSPDGSKLIFSRDAGDMRSIVLLDINIGIERELFKVKDNMFLAEPYFFDSNTILLKSGPELYVHYLSKPQSPEQVYSYEGRGGDCPIYSNDRAKTAFTRIIGEERVNKKPGDGSCEIFVADSKGKNATQITHNGIFKRVEAFTPDGRSIFFLSSEKWTWCGGELWQVDIDGSNLTKINLR